MNNQNEIVEIFAGEFYQASMIKDLLEDNNIEVFIENELMGNIAPWYVASGGVAFWLMKNWSDEKKGICDGWTECHSSKEVDAITYAG